jgi:polar amino acid transport system substrate-binding protein
MYFASFLLISLLLFNHAQATDIAAPEVRLCYEDVSVYPWITGDMKGLVIQELLHVEKITKIKLKFIRLPWKRCQIDAKNGKLDGLIAASFTKERTQWGVYPTKKSGELNRNLRLHTDSFKVFTSKGSSIRFSNGRFENLGKHLIGVQLGYSVGTDLEEQGYATHSSFSTAHDLLQALDSKVVKVAVLQNYETIKTLKDNPWLKKNIIGQKHLFKVADQYLLFTKKFYSEHPEISKRLWNAIPTTRESTEYKKNSINI